MKPTITRPQMSLPDQRGSRCCTPANRLVASVAVDRLDGLLVAAGIAHRLHLGGRTERDVALDVGFEFGRSSTGSAIVSHSRIDQSVEAGP